MYAATHEHAGDADIFIATAAVSDYRPLSAKTQKIKKNDQSMSIELVRSPDILASVAAIDDAPFTVGFAAETENLREYALGKLNNKKLNMIIANQVGENLGFDSDVNTVDVYWPDGGRPFDLTEKAELARALVKLIAERYEIEYSAEQHAIN